MATTTIFASANSGGLLCQNGTYSVARSGAGTLSLTPANDARLGQRFAFGTTYFCWQFGLEFDLTALAGATITAATLSIWLTADDSGTDFTVDARAVDYGPSYTTADFVAGASLSGNTLLATRATAGIGSDGAYKAFTDVAMVSFLVPGSVNRMVLSSSRQAAGNTPTGSEYITSYYDNTGGDGVRAKLDITYTPAPAGTDVSPGNASGTGAASTAGANVKPPAGLASATGAAPAAGVSSSQSATAGVASAAGWASQGSGSEVDADAQAAAGTVSAPTAGVSLSRTTDAVTATAAAHAGGHDLGVPAGLASPNATAGAFGATVDVVQGAFAEAEVVAATIEAYDATATPRETVAADAEHVTVTVATAAPSLSVRATTSAAAATAQASDTQQTYGSAGHSAATGASSVPAPSVAPVAAHVTATAVSAAPSTAVVARAGHAAATASAEAVAIALAMHPAAASAIAAAYPDQVAIATGAGLVSVAGVAYGRRNRFSWRGSSVTLAAVAVPTATLRPDDTPTATLEVTP